MKQFFAITTKDLYGQFNFKVCFSADITECKNVVSTFAFGPFWNKTG
jgi:hypothetical protein